MDSQDKRTIQSETDKLVVTITQASNGFIVRIFPKRLVFFSLKAAFDSIENHFNTVNKGKI